MAGKNTLAALVIGLSSLFRPPERLTVTQAAAKYRHLNNSPVYMGPYLPEDTAYMVDPMNTTQSREHTSVVFVGPAQSGKTEGIVLNVVAYLIMCNPMDCIIYHMSQAAARDFSKRRIDRMHRHSQIIGDELREGSNSDNTHDKHYKSGMLLSISWPSISEMSSKPVPVVIFTDYDRMPDDIDGEGSPFVLGQKRTTTFRNLGMTIVDSSPGREIEVENDQDAERKRVKGEHEAPPCTGILGLYNQGDRQRWNWPCPYCREFFEPSFASLRWETKDADGKPLSIAEMGDSVRMPCPHCEARIEHHHKTAMNRAGVWLREGEKITADGVRYGTPRRSKMASYWLRGPAATYITWREMVVKFLEAELHYERTGSQEELKATVNTDQAEPYKPRGQEQSRLAEDLEERALDLPVKMVPPDVRALIATMDTQGTRWEVQVHGIRPGTALDNGNSTFDTVLIDRFKIQKSARVDADGDTEWVKPASYPEDWDLIVPQVMEKRYPLYGMDGTMGISLTACDSGGGKARNHDKKQDEVDENMSVTFNAYNFWRRLKKRGLHQKFFLVKGDSNLMAPRAHLEYPDSQRKDRNAGAKGEIPVLFLNVNALKDWLNAILDRTEGSGGRIEFPNWLPTRFFEELTAEVRGKRGWLKLGSRRNESWDLVAYFLGVCVYRRVEKVNWASPPPWLAPWAENSNVTLIGPEGAPVDKKVKPVHRLAELGAELS